MTTVSYETYYDEHKLVCVGHTGYGDHGSDILCSAVSILCHTARAYLENAYIEGLVSSLDADVGSGFANISFTCPAGSIAEKCFEAIIGGMRLLGECFPDNIVFDN